MGEEKMFQGIYTAIVTPFDEYEHVDYDALKKIIEFQVSSGVQGIVVCGTTGESPTLSHEEHRAVVEFVVERVAKRVKVIAGTGSNCTREALELTEHAERSGADASLQVNPYYNKPSQEGLYRHFKEIANSTKLPIILYNIKGRTGVNIETPTLIRLTQECKNIVGVKEASGDLNQIKEVIAKRPTYFSVLSGDDSIAFDVIKAGGDGVICTSSNVIPKETTKMVTLALQGKFSESEALNQKLMPIFKAAFIETNPMCIKYMASLIGLCKAVWRLPICEPLPATQEKIKQEMKAFGLVK